MAISNDPLKISSLVETTDKTSGFTKISDTVKKQAADIQNGVNNDALSKTKSGTSVLDRVKSTNVGMDKLMSSTFTDIVCCKLPSKILMTDIYLEGLNRNYSYGSNNIEICELSKIKNPFDAAMKVSAVIRDYPGLLSSSMETRLNTLIKSDLTTKMNIFGLGNIIPTCVLGNTVNSIAGTSSALGSNIHEKNELKALMSQNACAAAIANTPLVSGWLSKSTAANLINVIIDSNKSGISLYRFIDTALSVTDQRSSAIGGLISSIAYATDKNLRVKLDAVRYLYTNHTLTPSEQTALKYFNTKDLLSKVDEELAEENVSGENTSTTLTKTDNKTELDNMMATIDILNPTWQLWDLLGSKTICDLSNKTLQSKEIKNKSLSVTVTTDLKIEHKVAIACRFSHKDFQQEHA